MHSTMAWLGLSRLRPQERGAVCCSFQVPRRQDQQPLGKEPSRCCPLSTSLHVTNQRLAGQTARFYTRTSGSPHLGDYRVNFYTTGDDGQELQVSPWHDVPLRTTRGTYNFICEIPKWYGTRGVATAWWVPWHDCAIWWGVSTVHRTRKKYEIATGEEFNPIRQDLDKSGTLRE